MSRTLVLPVVALGVLVAAAPAPVVFRDATLAVELPAGWTIDGRAGEYQLGSESQDVASLLLLLAEFDGTLNERLARIEEQFVETGLIEPELAESRKVDGVLVLHRRYRLSMGGTRAGDGDAPAGDGDSILLHQYSFERAGVPVLLQVETAPGGTEHETLFRRIFATLEIRSAPPPFRIEDPAEDPSS